MDEPTAQWILRSQEADGWRQIAEECSLHPIVARMLARRGFDDPEEADAFLNPRLSRMHDPSLMADMGAAVETLLGALDRDATIAIHGDYDVDGLTSTALLVEFLRQMEAEVDYLIPHRIDDGYGVEGDTIAEIVESGADLLVTADCGVTAYDAIEQARRAGMDVIVIDHHALPDELPPANAVLNPLRHDCDFPFDGLSAAGVTFNFLVALRGAMRQRGDFERRAEPDLMECLDLVALGTVADVVPLRDVNRTYVRRGLQLMSEGPRPGVAAILKRARSENGPVTTQTVGYKIAPRLNAAGRISDATICVELMTTRDGRRAGAIADDLERLNGERREIQDQVLEEATAEADRQRADGADIIVVDGEGWHRGVLGIVAGRLSDRHRRPVIALERDDQGVARGSARSIEGVDIVELLGAADELLDRYGGHAAAAGMTLPAANIPDLRAQLARQLDARLPDDEEGLPAPSIPVEDRVKLGMLDRRFVRDLDRLRPFGEGNPEPVFVCEEIRTQSARIVGDDHLKVEFSDGTGELGGIGFSMGEQMEMLDQPVAAAFVPRWSVFRGRGRLEMHLRGLRPSDNDLFEE